MCEAGWFVPEFGRFQSGIIGNGNYRTSGGGGGRAGGQGSRVSLRHSGCEHPDVRLHLQTPRVTKPVKPVINQSSTAQFGFLMQLMSAKNV